MIRKTRQEGGATVTEVNKCLGTFQIGHIPCKEINSGGSKVHDSNPVKNGVMGPTVSASAASLDRNRTTAQQYNGVITSHSQ